jgi:hypothetical protein
MRGGKAKDEGKREVLGRGERVGLEKGKRESSLRPGAQKAEEGE